MNNLFGLIGKKLGHSFSPDIHNIIFEMLNIKGQYNLYEVKEGELKNCVNELSSLCVKGVNVTIPYKVEIMKYLNEISPEAEKIGAVNTLKFSDGIISGYNTDYKGFGASLINSKVNIKNKTALILGTGGVSKAVSQYLIDNGIKDIVYVSRNSNRAENNIMGYKVIDYNEVCGFKNGDIIINCTPCGMYPDIDKCPVNKDLLSNFSVAVDLIYNPEKTIFLKHSEELGLKTVNGLYMLVSQAVAAQEIWQNIHIEDEVTLKIYDKIKTLF